MADPVRRLPVLLEGVDADLPWGTDVGVKYLRCEPTYKHPQKSTSGGHRTIETEGGKRTLWRRSRKFIRELELHSKITPGVRGTLYRAFVSQGVFGVCVAHHTEEKKNSPGPSIIPVTSNISSSLVCTRIPSGGLFFRSFNSRMTRRITWGDVDCPGRCYPLRWGSTMKGTHHLEWCSWLKGRRGAWRTTWRVQCHCYIGGWKLSNQRCHVYGAWPSVANIPKYGVQLEIQRRRCQGEAVSDCSWTIKNNNGNVRRECSGVDV